MKNLLKHLKLSIELSVNLASIVMLILALLTSGNAWAEDSKHIEILVLHSYHYGYVWTSHVEEGMKETFKKSDLNIRRFIEYMDTKRFQEPEHYRLFKAFLRNKLPKYDLKLIIATDNNAFSFALKHRSELFPGLPIVFCGVNDFQESMLNGQHNVTGVSEVQSLSKTLSIALRLHPGTHEIVAISGNELTSDRAFRRQLLTVFSEFENRVRITLWDDLPMTELADRLSRLSKGQIALLNGEIRDEKGKPLGLLERAQFLQRYCHVPLYSSWEHVLGTGILGGKLISAYEQGRHTAELALRVLHGENPDDIPVITDDSNKFMFDYKELKRFDVAMDEVPPESKVINPPSSFYSVTKGYIWTGLVLIGFLSLMLIILFVNIRRRQQAEKAVRKAHDELEIRVVERTSELTLANEHLKQEVEEREQAEAALKESEERHRSLLESSPDSIVVYDMGGKATYVNSAFEQTFGWSRDELLGERTDFVPEDNWPETRDAIEKMLRGEKIHSFETRRLTKEGNMLDVQISASLFKGRDARHAGNIVTLRDITEHKRAEEALRESGERLRAITDTVTDAIILLDNEGRISFWNPASEKIFGYSIKEVIGKDLHLLLAPEEFHSSYRNGFNKFKTTGQGPAIGNTLEFKAIKKDGTIFPIEVSTSSLKINGKWHAAGIIRDISGRKQTEEDLQKYSEIQEVLLREVNHRVKNNLSAIIGMLYKEQERTETYGTTSYLDIFGDLIGRVEGLSTVHSLLSKSGWRPLLLTELCEQVINAALQGIPPDKKIALDVKASSLRVNSNQAHHLTLVINELATNALKHALGERDAVRISVEFLRDDEMIRIIFRDNGPGYPEEMIDGNFNRASVGFNLILGIIKESLRGEVQLENDNGAVTTIMFKNRATDQKLEV